jgi:hypothetical protein
MRHSARSLSMRALLILGLGITGAHAQTFVSTLSGASENPPVVTPASGTTTVTIDQLSHTLRVQTTFTGLTSNTTAAHIHCCINPPANVGVASTTPSFVGFPLGVTFGTMDETYNTLLASTYSPAFLAANGGTPAGAEAALFSGILAGRAYLNIHTTTNPGGEIRGFLIPASFPRIIPTLTHGLLGVLGLMLAAGAWFTWRRRRA